MVRAKLKFRLHRAVIVLICLALLVALMQGGLMVQPEQPEAAQSAAGRAGPHARPAGHAQPGAADV